MQDFIEEALPANSGVDDKGLEELVASFVSEGMAAQIASEGVASQTSMSLDAFFAACHMSQVRSLTCTTFYNLSCMLCLACGG